MSDSQLELVSVIECNYPLVRMVHDKFIYEIAGIILISDFYSGHNINIKADVFHGHVD